MARRRFTLREPVFIALQALTAHKLRSFLTLFGVIIAVTALIGVMSFVNGMNLYIAERVANFGANTFYVTRFGIITNAKDMLEARRRNKKMDMDDFEYLRAHMTLAEMVGAQDWYEKDVRAGNESLEDAAVRGVTANMIDISTDKLASGRYISEADYERRGLVAFIGTDVVDRFFPTVDPLGKSVSIEGIPFEIVGTAEKVGTVFGQSQDNFVVIPLSTMYKLWGGRLPDVTGPLIGVKCSSPAVMRQAMDQARALMRARRHQKYDEPDAFGIIASESLTDLWDQIFGGLAQASIGIVSVFLVIGGVVIMNIMLASVTERTREIGIRKSLGAHRRDILLQFLIESSVMSAAGGLLGVATAVGLVQLVAATTPVPVRTSGTAVVIALALSTAVGLFFGMWPAYKAARLDPVVALRAE